MVVVIVFFIFLMTKGKKSSDDQNLGNTLPQTQKLAKVESSVKVSVKKSPDGKKATLTVTGIPGKYTDIDYEFTYDTAEGVPRGVLGVLEIEDGVAEKEVVLGSCSTNVCSYDEGVNKVLVSLKFNGTGESKMFEKEFPLR